MKKALVNHGSAVTCSWLRLNGILFLLANLLRPSETDESTWSSMQKSSEGIIKDLRRLRTSREAVKSNLSLVLVDWTKGAAFFSSLMLLLLALSNYSVINIRRVTVKSQSLAN